MPEAPVQRLAAASLPRRLQKGQLLFSQGEPGDAVYVVASGRIAIVLATADGRELVINEMRAGDFFGELALFPGQTHTAGAVAQAASLVVCIPCGDFLAGRIWRHRASTCRWPGSTRATPSAPATVSPPRTSPAWSITLEGGVIGVIDMTTRERSVMCHRGRARFG